MSHWRRSRCGSARRLRGLISSTSRSTTRDSGRHRPSVDAKSPMHSAKITERAKYAENLGRHDHSENLFTKFQAIGSAPRPLLGPPKGYFRICEQRIRLVWLGFSAGENFLSSLSSLNSCEFGRKGTPSSNLHRKLLNRYYLLAVGGVSCEPLSATNSLLTGKNTGNFCGFGLRFRVADPRSY